MNKIFFLVLTISLSSCSSIAFWQSDEIDPDEPRELIDLMRDLSLLKIGKRNLKERII